MGKHGTNGVKHQAYQCFMEGLSIEQAVEKTKIKHGQVKTYYTDFIVHSARIKSNDNENKLMQAGAIERALFALIKANGNTQKIDELQASYSRFNALN